MQISSAEQVAWVSTQLKELSGEHFAVRSSATVEDGSEHSWAGQFESFLNVPRHEVLTAIERCRDSVHRREVTHYSEQHAQRDIQLAVIVQQMIEPKIAGVAFSVHPVTKQKGQVVIEAVEGLAEKLVQGEVTPSLTVVDAQTLVTIEQDGTDLFLNSPLRDQLVKLVLQVKELMKIEVDAEWAIDQQDQIWLLQARPVTTV